ncbi:MAG: hypothetical protein Q9200_007710 [Gallowayella weberi]
MTPPIYIFLILISSFISLPCIHASPATSPPKANTPSLAPDDPLTLNSNLFQPTPNTSLSELPPECYHKTRSARYPQVHPVNRQDCIQLVFQMVIKPQSTLAFMWDPRTMRLPVDFTFGQCTVSVQSSAKTNTDAFSVVAVARVAGLIIDQCATRANGYLGGRLTVGVKGFFWVIVSQ